MYMYVCMYICVCICMYMSAYMCLCICMCVYVCIRKRRYLYISYILYICDILVIYKFSIIINPDSWLPHANKEYYNIYIYIYIYIYIINLLYNNI